MSPSERLKHPEDWVGELLHGKWRIDELLGLGGVASVYAATDRMGERVAVKIMHGYWIDEPNVRERFLREGYAANRVKHPGVVSASADGVTEGGTPFLVLELLEGRNLDAELLINGMMTAERVLRMADQVLDALATAHDINVLHRDLKPENLFLMSDDTIRILDFGIARMHDQENQRLTINGRAMGTPGFMAPEQARGEWESVDARVDVWSLGATMFTMLTGCDVHTGQSQQELLVASMMKPAPPIREVEPSVPARIANIIDTALAFDRHERYPSARAMQRAVRAAMEGDVVDDAPPTLRPVSMNPDGRAAARGWRRAWRPVVVAAACIAAVTAIAADLSGGDDVRGPTNARAASTIRGLPAIAGDVEQRAISAAVASAERVASTMKDNARDAAYEAELAQQGADATSSEEEEDTSEAAEPSARRADAGVPPGVIDLDR